MSKTLRAGAFESLDMDGHSELAKMSDALEQTRNTLYGGHDTAHPEIKDTPESVFRLRKHALRPDMSRHDRQILFDNIAMMHSLYASCTGT